MAISLERANVDRATKSFALNRINNLLERTFSVVAPIVCLQMVVNGIAQSHLLNPWFFWPSLAALVLANLGLVLGVWLTNTAVVWERILVLCSLLAVISWPLQVADSAGLPDNFQPWIWWAVGIAAIASIGAFSVLPAALIVVFLPLVWFFVRQLPEGGGQEFWPAVQDSLTTFTFSSTFVILVIGLRFEAAKVDAANQKAAEAAVELARVDAIERERGRVDALVHDSVLTTLLVAASALDEDQRAASKALAESAIKKLNEAKSENLEAPKTISVSSLFSALEQAAKRAAQDLNVHVEGSSDSEVPSMVAAAVSEATIQSVTNSVQHAGTVSQRELFLRGTNRGFKIVIKDNGRGFRPSRIPKNRLGVRLSVISRVEDVGGRVFLDAKPGSGTSVIIEWIR